MRFHLLEGRARQHLSIEIFLSLIVSRRLPRCWDAAVWLGIGGGACPVEPEFEDGVDQRVADDVDGERRSQATSTDRVHSDVPMWHRPPGVARDGRHRAQWIMGDQSA